MYNWYTLLYSRNKCNIVNQLYSNKIFKINKNKMSPGFWKTKNESKLKTSNKRKQRGFIANRPVLQEISKEVLHAEGKSYQGETWILSGANREH